MIRKKLKRGIVLSGSAFGIGGAGDGLNLGAGGGVQHSIYRDAVFWHNHLAAVTSGGKVTEVPAKYRGEKLTQEDSTKQPTFAAGSVNNGTVTLLKGRPQQANASYLSMLTLPDGAPGATPGAGFTNTGLVKMPDGTWWVGYHGVADISDVTFDSGIIHLSADFSAILHIVLSADLGASPVASVQGVTYDPIENTVCFAHAGDSKIYRIDATTRALVGTTTKAVNGIAYDATNDQFATLTDTGLVIWINKSTGATIKSLALNADGGPNYDHLFWTASYLYFSYGLSAYGDGRIGRINLATYAVEYEWLLQEANAIEGFHLENGIVTVCNDGGFHGGGQNTIMRFSVAPPALVAPAARFYIGLIAKLNAAPGGSAATILSYGDPNSDTILGNGIGIYVPAGSSTALRVFAAKALGSGNRASGDFAVTSTSDFLVVVDVNFAAGTAQPYVNGVAVGSTLSLAAIAGGALNANREAIGAAIQGGVAARWTSCTVYGDCLVNYADTPRDFIEGRLAWDAGKTSLLPVGHTYKTVAPPA